MNVSVCVWWGEVMNVSVCVVGGGDACECVCGGGRECT